VVSSHRMTPNEKTSQVVLYALPRSTSGAIHRGEVRDSVPLMCVLGIICDSPRSPICTASPRPCRQREVQAEDAEVGDSGTRVGHTLASQVALMSTLGLLRSRWITGGMLVCCMPPHAPRSAASNTPEPSPTQQLTLTDGAGPPTASTSSLCVPRAHCVSLELTVCPSSSLCVPRRLPPSALAAPSPTACALSSLNPAPS
jgi:hypothetical protein